MTLLRSSLTDLYLSRSVSLLLVSLIRININFISVYNTVLGRLSHTWWRQLSAISFTVLLYDDSGIVSSGHVKTMAVK